MKDMISNNKDYIIKVSTFTLETKEEINQITFKFQDAEGSNR